MKSDKKLLILVEGRGDKRFLEDVCSVHIEHEFEIIPISGKPNWKEQLNLLSNQLQENLDLGGRNLLILDADKDSISDWEGEVKLESDKLGISIEGFMFPDHGSEGDLESLLLKIVPTKNLAFIECWNEYLECITTKLPAFPIPSRKETISSYLSWFHSDKSKTSAGKRGYSTSPLWNLNHPALDPLIQFLKGE